MSRKKNDRFPFCPSDWLGGTASLTAAERGVYIDLLAEQWQRGPLTEQQALSAGRAMPNLIEDVLRKKFHRNSDGTWQNNRLELERSKSKSKGKRTSKSQQLALSEPFNGRPLLLFECRGEPKHWGLSVEQYEAWCAMYPGIDILGECRKALAWCEANGFKTYNGMPRFLVNWINRATNQSRGSVKQQTFKERDEDNRKKMLLKLRLEQLGCSRTEAERLSNMTEQEAIAEANRLAKQRPIAIHYHGEN